MKRFIRFSIFLTSFMIAAAMLVSLSGCQTATIAQATTEPSPTLSATATSLPEEASAELMAIAVAAQMDNVVAAQPTPSPTPEPTPSPTVKPQKTPKPTPKKTPKPTPTPKITKLDKRQGTIKGDNVLMRKEPSSNAKKLEWFNKDTKVMVIGKVNDYYQVTHGSKTGFIAKRFVKLAAFSEEELYLAAQLITAEGRGQSVKGYETMAQIVYNRVKSRKFPNTIEKVAFQSGQFSVTRNRSWFLKIKPTSRAKNAVREIFLNGKRVIPTDVMFFKSARLSKSWGSRKYYCTIDGTMYYK